MLSVSVAVVSKESTLFFGGLTCELNGIEWRATNEMWAGIIPFESGAQRFGAGSKSL